MKRRVSGLVVTAVFGLAGSFAMAQDPPQPNASPANAPVQSDAAHTRHRQHAIDPDLQAQHMAKRLKLTPEQQSQVVTILTAQRDQAAGLRQDTSLSKEDRQAKMAALRTDSQSKIRALLTDDQKTSFDQMQQQRHDRHAEKKG